jgi:hypothetical protein
MCWFWYAGFLQFVKDYHWILRIDSDCVMEVAGDPWLNGLQPGSRIGFMSQIDMDASFVIIGMRELFTNLAIERGLNPFPEEWKSPLSNVMAIDVQWFRHDHMARHAFKAVNASRCVWLNRWGDMPLWGATITLLDVPRSHVQNFNYYHGSWNTHVVDKQDGSR